jgi:hypothetical protein
MTVIADDRLIEVTYRGITCRFDGTPIHDVEDPGGIYRSLLRGEFYEQDFLDYIRSLQIRGVYVDVGSCIGTHALFFALMCPSTKVYAFEPRAHLFERVLTNTRLNAADHKITAYPWALSDEAGEVTVTLDRREYTLDCRRLDDVLPDRIDVVKIDVEGMEPRVIDGAMASLARWRPRIFAEAGESAQYEALVACLARHGYRPTGRVFGWTPTYEFVPVARSTWERVRDIATTDVPRRTRGSLGRLVRHYPRLGTVVRDVRRLRGARRRSS